MIADLFSGPRGWSVGLRMLGHADVGIEWDEAACATAAAAGHLTIRADVAAYPTEPFVGKVTGLIASPPCQLFSSAGKGTGRAVLDELRRGISDLVGGSDTRDRVRSEVAATILPIVMDEMVAAARKAGKPMPTTAEAAALSWRRAVNVCLVLEPARWVADLRPEWMALEQVPEVLSLWDHLARCLAELGYHAWCGVLNAADYGVPQTRKRAILMASRTKRVHAPTPTHCDQRRSPSLFLLPWVSMAEALGWDDVLLRHSFGTSSPDSWTPHLVGSDNPAPTVDTKARGWKVETRGDRTTPGGNEFDADGPSWALTEKARSWKVRTGDTTSVTGDLYERDATEPAPTVRSRSDLWKWLPVLRAGSEENAPERPLDEPAPTLAFSHDAASWAFTAPATTVAGDPRISSRVHHDDGVSQGGNAVTTDTVREGGHEGWEPIKLTITEALLLQSFPPDYPVQGSRSAQFRQVGDAVPPLLARAVLEVLL